MPAERIATLMAGRSTEQTRQMLFEGVEIVVRETDAAGSAPAPGLAVSWKRVGVAPGIELHLCEDLPKPKPAELKKLLALLETALRKNL